MSIFFYGDNEFGGILVSMLKRIRDTEKKMSLRRRKIITIAFLLCIFGAIIGAIIINVPWPEGSSTFQTEIVAEAGQEVATTLWQVQFEGNDVRLYRLGKDAQDPNSERPQEQPEDDKLGSVHITELVMWPLRCFEKTVSGKGWLDKNIGGIEIPENYIAYPGYPKPDLIRYAVFPSGLYVHREDSGGDLLFLPVKNTARAAFTISNDWPFVAVRKVLTSQYSGSDNLITETMRGDSSIKLQDFSPMSVIWEQGLADGSLLILSPSGHFLRFAKATSANKKMPSDFGTWNVELLGVIDGIGNEKPINWTRPQSYRDELKLIECCRCFGAGRFVDSTLPALCTKYVHRMKDDQMFIYEVSIGDGKSVSSRVLWSGTRPKARSAPVVLEYPTADEMEIAWCSLEEDQGRQRVVLGRYNPSADEVSWRTLPLAEGKVEKFLGGYIDARKRLGLFALQEKAGKTRVVHLYVKRPF